MTTSDTYSDVVDTHIFILARVNSAGRNPIASRISANAKIEVNTLGVRAVGAPSIWNNQLDTQDTPNLTSGVWAVCESILKASGRSSLRVDGAEVDFTTALQGSAVELNALFNEGDSSNADIAFLAVYDTASGAMASSTRIYDELATRRAAMNA
jgi:hypothetical protein